MLIKVVIDIASKLRLDWARKDELPIRAVVFNERERFEKNVAGLLIGADPCRVKYPRLLRCDGNGRRRSDVIPIRQMKYLVGSKRVFRMKLRDIVAVLYADEV